MPLSRLSSRFERFKNKFKDDRSGDVRTSLSTSILEPGKSSSSLALSDVEKSLPARTAQITQSESTPSLQHNLPDRSAQIVEAGSTQPLEKPVGTVTIRTEPAPTSEEKLEADSRITATSDEPQVHTIGGDPPPYRPLRYGKELWAQGYARFEQRQPEIAQAYALYIVSVRDPDTKLDDGDAIALEPTTVRSVVSTLLEERRDNQWRFGFHGKNVVVRNEVEKLAKFLLWSNGIVQKALSAQPYAALAWSGVSMLLPLLTAGSADFEAMVSGFHTINRIQTYWRLHEDKFPNFFQDGSNRDAWECLAELYSMIFEYQARVVRHLSNGQASRVMKTMAGGNEWDTQTERIIQASEECKGFADLEQVSQTQEQCDRQMRDISESREYLFQIASILEDERRQRVVDRDDQRERELLSLLAVDHEGPKNINPKKVPGTCEWLLEDESFLSWRESQESRLLWVTAGPGCGKSVLLRSLIDDWQLRDNASTTTVCHFFFKDGEEARERHFNAIRALLHQLFTQDLSGKFMDIAFKAHKDYGSSLASNFDRLWDILVACASIREAGEIVCVLDAFDECSKGDRHVLVEKLRGLYEDGPGSKSGMRLKFLLTSRPYMSIESLFAHFPSIGFLRIEAEEHAVAIRDDINLVIDATVPSMFGQFRQADRERITQRLKDMEGRTYLWLKLIFYIIKEDPGRHARVSSIEELLDDLPEEHAEAYEKILSRVSLPLKGKKRRKNYTKPLLEILLAAQRPLSLAEANCALTWATNEKETWPEATFDKTVKELCGLLVTVHDSHLYFLHQTVREFLLDEDVTPEPTRWQGGFRTPDCNNTMTYACIEYLLQPQLAFTGDLEEVFTLAHMEDLVAQADIEEDDHYTLFLYAATFWPAHFLAQDEPAMEALTGKAQSLCMLGGTARHHWVEYHGDYHHEYGDEQHEGQDWTPLALASFLGLTVVVKAIMQDPNTIIDQENSLTGTALAAGASQGHEEIVRILLDSGAADNARGSQRMTPLEVAVSSGNLEVVKMFSKLRESESRVTTWMIETAVELHAGVPMVEFLLSHKADDIHITEAVVKGAAGNPQTGLGLLHILLKSADGELQLTEAILAAAAGNEDSGPEVMRFLLENGKGDTNFTPTIFEAIWVNWKTAAEVLLVLYTLREEDIKYDLRMWFLLCRTATPDEAKKALIPYLLRGSAGNLQLDNTDGDTIMHNFVRSKSDFNCISWMLACDVDPNLRNDRGISLLHTAARSGQPDIVRLLAEFGADVNSQDDEDQYTPLMTAIIMDNTEMARAILDIGPELETSNKYGSTAMHMATQFERLEIIEMLIEKGAAVDSPAIPETPLYAAVKAGMIDICRLLLDNGANVNCENDTETALHVAASKGHDEIAKLLLEHGAEMETICENEVFPVKHGFTPLHLAAMESRLNIVHLLLEKGADINARSGYGFTPLRVAVERNRLRVTKLLLEKGADYSIPDHLGDTALRSAIEGVHCITLVVKALLDMDTETLKSPDRHGHLLVHKAALRGRADIFELVADPESLKLKDGYQQSMLSFAVRSGSVGVVEQILMTNDEYLADADDFGRTPMWWAMRQQSESMIRILDLHAKHKGIDVKPKLKVYKDAEPLDFGLGPRECNICCASIKTMFRCTVCDGGYDFDVCTVCKDLGGHCFDKSHELAYIEEED